MINIFGLAFGLCCVLLISLYVKDELSYDKFHTDADDIYRIAWWDENPQTRTPHPMALDMKRDFSEVVSATTLSPLWGPGLTKRIFSIRNPKTNVTFDETSVLSVDSTFLDVFSFNLIKGNKDKVLRNIGGILISESFASKYFGDQDPIGKELAIDNDEILLVVEGVFENVPNNSHFHFDMLISYVSLKAFDPDSGDYYTWNDFGHFNYIRLQPGTNAKALESRLLAWSGKYIQITEEDLRREANGEIGFRLQRMTDIHLHSKIRWELEKNGNVDYVYIMTAAALFILIIACINFMNLTTARSTERSKEIGIRKSLGAFKKQVAGQFLGESLITVFIALVFAGLLAEVSLPFFNYITDKSLDIKYVEEPQIILIFILVGIFTGFVAGIYPSLFLSSVNPVTSLKGIEKIKPKGAWLRKGLLVFQFTISMVLITGSIIIYDQLHFIKNKDLGFDKQRVINIPLKNQELVERFEAMKNEFLKVPGVKAVSAASNLPGQQFNQNRIFDSNQPDNSVNSSQVYVEYGIFDVLGLEFIDGRGFDKANPNDLNNALIINETAARNLGLIDPVGKEVSWDWDDDANPFKGNIIGLVKDFNYQSLHEPIRPLLFKLHSGYNHILLKVDGNNIAETIAASEKVWQQFEDRFVFEYSLLSDDLEYQYTGEEKTAEVFGGFSAIAILIAAFGLFGIATISFQRRKKEVSIRKVLGASVSTILSLLLKDFTRLIVVAIILAIPLAWWVMNRWLENFTFRINMNPINFAIAGASLVVIAWLTVSYLTLQTARKNPIDSLKEE